MALPKGRGKHPALERAATDDGSEDSSLFWILLVDCLFGEVSVPPWASAVPQWADGAIDTDDALGKGPMIPKRPLSWLLVAFIGDVVVFCREKLIKKLSPSFVGLAEVSWKATIAVSPVRWLRTGEGIGANLDGEGDDAEVAAAVDKACNKFSLEG